jgi:glutathione S-transferase
MFGVRIIEIGVLLRVGTIFQNTHAFMAGRLKQSADAAENARTQMAGTLKVVDEKIGPHAFVAGERVTIADCTLLAALYFADFAGVQIDPAFANVARWHADFKKRPSAAA